MKTKSNPTPILLLGILAVGLAGCESARDTRTTRDVAIGATAGAVIGGVIGHNSGDEAGAGAAIGAVVGGAAGAVHANARERERERDDRPRADDYYRSLLSAEEVDILRARARASGRRNYELTDFLTSDEKDNLRRRDAVRRGDDEIGR
jgi:uncharacterized protein YcfJ